MMCTKYYYYVLVRATRKKEVGGVFVTKYTNAGHIAEWKREEKPLAMTKTMADQIAVGLCCNGTPAVRVESSFEMADQYFVAWEDDEEEDCPF